MARPQQGGTASSRVGAVRVMLAESPAEVYPQQDESPRNSGPSGFQPCASAGLSVSEGNEELAAGIHRFVTHEAARKRHRRLKPESSHGRR